MSTYRDEICVATPAKKGCKTLHGYNVATVAPIFTKFGVHDQHPRGYLWHDGCADVTPGFGDTDFIFRVLDLTAEPKVLSTWNRVPPPEIRPQAFQRAHPQVSRRFLGGVMANLNSPSGMNGSLSLFISHEGEVLQAQGRCLPPPNTDTGFPTSPPPSP